MKSTIELQKIYTQLARSHWFLVLSRSEITVLKGEIERAYPQIQRDIKVTSQERLKRVLISIAWIIGIMFVLGVLAIVLRIVILVGGIAL